MKTILDGYRLNYSKEAAVIGIHSPVYITHAALVRVLGSPNEHSTARLCWLLLALRRALRRNPFRYWLWRLFPNGSKQPLYLCLPGTGDKPAEAPNLVFQFTLPDEDDGTLLPEISIMLSDQ